MPLFLPRVCVKWHFVFLVFFSFDRLILIVPPEGKEASCVKTLLKNYEILLNLCGACRNPGSRKCATLSDVNNLHQCKYAFSGCPLCSRVLAITLLWCKI